MLGNKDYWNRKAKHKGLGSKIKDSNLLQDSTDFPKRMKVGSAKRNDWYAHKLGRCGRRIQMITDLGPRIVKIFPFTSPKVFDSDFVECNKSWYRKKLKGGVILADERYRVAKNRLNKSIDGISIHAPFRANDKNAKKSKTARMRQKKCNAQIQDSRGSVETPFGWMKNTFTCLNQPFNGNDKAFDGFIYFAAGAYNEVHRGNF